MNRSVSVIAKSTLFAAAGILTLTLTGCGRADDAATAPPPPNDGEQATTAPPVAAPTAPTEPATGNLTVWAMGAEGEVLDGFLDGFRAANPDVTISVNPIPWGAAADMFQTAVAAGTTPDVAMMGTTWMPDYAHAFVPVPAWIDTTSIFPGSLGTAEYRGQLVGVPWYVDTRVLYYRTDLAANAGWEQAPTDWAELTDFLTQCQAANPGVDYPILLPTSGQDAFQNAFWAAASNGASFTNAAGTEWTFDTPQMTEALEWYQSLFAAGLANPNLDPTPGFDAFEFAQGRTCAFISGPWMRGVLAQMGLDADQFNTALVPANTSSVSFVGGANLVVFEDSTNQDSAWQLVDWLTRPETQIEFFELTGNMPSSQTSWQDPALQADQKLVVFGTQMETAVAPPTTTAWAQVSDEADRQFERIIIGNTPVPEALAALQAAANNIGMGN